MCCILRIIIIVIVLVRFVCGLYVGLHAWLVYNICIYICSCVLLLLYIVFMSASFLLMHLHIDAPPTPQCVRVCE